MKRMIKWFAALCVSGCLLSSAALACRYTVRDTGFVDLGFSSYRLYLYTDEEGAEEAASTLRLHTALGYTNVKAEVIRVGRDKDHPAMRFHKRMEVRSLPAAILVSPEGRALLLPSIQGKGPLKDEVWPLLERVTTSKAREEILESILESFCVILLVPGEDEAANSASREAIEETMERIKGMMGIMPKPVRKPPLLITLQRDRISEERVLLWSLGLEDEGMEKPCAAVLYGKGRRMGPLLKGGEISERALFNLLLVVGADCECGLERSWLQGLMVPLRWEEGMQSRAVGVLGFDPENPMVKMEVSQILSSGTYGPGREGPGADPFDGDLLFGYSEQTIEFDQAETKGAEPEADPAAALPVQDPEETLEPGEEASPQRTALYSFGGIAALLGIFCILLVLKARRNQG